LWGSASPVNSLTCRLQSLDCRLTFQSTNKSAICMLQSALLLLALASARVSAQSPAAAPSSGMPTAFIGPPPPSAPDVIARDPASDRVTVRAVRLDSPLKVDGHLDEAVYQTVPAMSDFIQIEPSEGAPATEKTEVWLFYDHENVYVSARCWDS